MGRSPTARHPSPASPSAPLGIKILCVLGVIASVVTLFLSLSIMAAGGPFVTLGLLLVFLTIGYLVVIYGLWTVKKWGWKWGMIVFVLGAIMDLFQLEFISLFISIVLIAYLYSKRDFYRKHGV